MSRVKYAFIIFSILISNKCFAEQKKTKFGVEPFNTPQTKPKEMWDPSKINALYTLHFSITCRTDMVPTKSLDVFAAKDELAHSVSLKNSSQTNSYLPIDPVTPQLAAKHFCRKIPRVTRLTEIPPIFIFQEQP